MSREVRIEIPLVVANWKMYGLTEATRETLTRIILSYSEHGNIVICPPFIAMRAIGNAIDGTKLHMGGQDCHEMDDGAYTGDVSAKMLYNAGCDYVIVGHSERRVYHKETNELVSRKAEAAHRNKLVPIICIGETEQERATGQTLKVIEEQLLNSVPKSAKASNTVIAYEPVWAIGSNQTPKQEEIAEVHNFIQELAQKRFKEVFPVLYGGSVKASNTSKILSIPSVSGVLVGSASLDATEFSSIAEIAFLNAEKRK